MRSYLISGAAALALCVALPALAQSTPASPSKSAPPANSTATPPASTAVNPAATTTDPTMPPATGNPSTASSPSSAGAGAMTSSPSAASAATNSSANAPIASGLSVKDNTGATIGQITQVKPDASGKQTATIKMGADSFAVDTSALVVQNGAAVINSTQAELQGMIKKATPPAPPAEPEATTPKTKKK